MKKQKLTLQELKVSSFVTKVAPDGGTVKGGIITPIVPLSIYYIVDSLIDGCLPDAPAWSEAGDPCTPGLGPMAMSIDPEACTDICQ